jgi:DNA repair exonuclease SbcCD ATPase subunit
MYPRHFKKREDEKLRDLSPLLLKRKIEKLRRQLVAAQDALPQAEEKDRQLHLLCERSWDSARAEIIFVKQKLATVSEQIHKDYPSSTFGTILDLFLDFFEIGRFWKRDRSAEEALYVEKHKLEKRCKVLRGIVGSVDPVPEHHENPYSKRGPDTFHQREAQWRLDSVKAELERHLEALGGDTARLERLEAVEARVFQKERELAAKLRLTFKPTDQCPYCGRPLGSNPHLDHIYPVSKGGLSVSTNLVFVCLQCNQWKSDMTLAVFLKANNLDRQAVEARLTHLAKDF